jgi:hypothetical protein
MLNLNLNIIECQRRTIAPVLVNAFDYLIIGGGGGAQAGQGAIGGNGGAGGQVVSGSFDFTHGTSATLNIGTGGIGGGAIGANGTNGVSSSLIYQATTFTANGGAAGTNSTQNRGGITSTIDSIPTGGGEYLWAQMGTKGGDSPAGSAGVGGGTSNQEFPWGTSPFLSAQTAYFNSGGGGGGFRWDEFNPGGQTGNGAAGMCMLRFADPRDVFTYTGDWSVFVYQNGYKYFYWQNNGTFTFLGKRD